MSNGNSIKAAGKPALVVQDGKFLPEAVFGSVIGQEHVKSTLTFYLQTYRATGFVPPLLLTARHGAGKTTLSRLFGQGLGKMFIEINGASIKKLSSFVQSIVLPYLTGNQQVTVFIDEIHAVCRDFQDWMLSALQIDDNYMSRARFGEELYVFDHKLVTFIFATTNPESIIKPLMSRFRRIDFGTYTHNELKNILNNKLSDFIISEEVANKVVSVARRSPRTVTLLANDIRNYMLSIRSRTITPSDWEKISRMLGIYPYGLNSTEVNYLRQLKSCGPLTLTAISAKLALDASTVRREVESYLLSENLIMIDGKRTLTKLGYEVVNTVDHECR